MRALIVYTPNVNINKQNKQLKVCYAAGEEKSIRINDYETYIFFTGVNISTPALLSLSSENKNVLFLNSKGDIKCQIFPYTNKNLDLKIKQYKFFEQNDNVLLLSKAVVKNKITNSLNLFRTFGITTVKKNFRAINKALSPIIKSVDTADSIENLLGIEGNAAKLHFTYLSQFSTGSLHFQNRSQRPPKDEANAILSFGYTLLTNIVNGLIIAHGLDPYLGFLHKPDYGRPSLALDILEPYRSIIVDRFFLFHTNKNWFNKDDFENKNNNAFYFNNDGIKKFFTFWYDFVFVQNTFIDLINNDIELLIKTIRQNNTDFFINKAGNGND